ncbi:MAG: hypothetical protein KAR85_05965 [Methanosarcinales archaeon]|nr:hypothetical protein [Methanosarcinales archaeon]
MNEKISSAIKNVPLSMKIVIALLLLLNIVFLLAYIIKQSISINASNMSLLNLSCSIILLFITAIYVSLTANILGDQRKSRQIAFIERRLEKLYYPIKDVLSNPFTPHSSNDVKQIEWKKVESIVPFQYLAYEKSKDIINEFINKVIKSKTEYEGDLSFSNFENDELKTIINNDIEMYEKELDELTKN